MRMSLMRMSSKKKGESVMVMLSAKRGFPTKQEVHQLNHVHNDDDDDDKIDDDDMLHKQACRAGRAQW